MNNRHILSVAISSLLVLGLASGNASAADKRMGMKKCSFASTIYNHLERAFS